MERIAIRVVIEGRVQGVWYRGWTVDQARARGLDGWVRNRMDGTVEALFGGPADAVRAMIEACRQGPPAARVDAIREMPGEMVEGGGFQQLPTV
jgi:acylphosphatase